MGVVVYSGQECFDLAFQRPSIGLYNAQSFNTHDLQKSLK